MKAKLVLVFLSLFIAKVSVSQPAYPGHSIGTATITVSGDQILIVNNVLSAKWKIKDHLIQAESILDKETQQLIQWNNNIWFSISLKNGESLSSNEFKLINNLKIQNIHANSQSINRSGKDKGKKLSVDLYCEKAQLKLHWEVILKNNSNYIRQQFTLTPEDSLMVDKINLLEIPQASGVKPYGLVAGSPIVSEEIFFAFEHPMSQNEITSGKMVSFIKRYSALKSSAPLTFSVVWGVSPHNQVRRSFLYYLERERVVPYHQQLHYNSWYDLSWTDRKLDDKSCQDRIQMFGDSLITKRHTPMKAFLFDDGWDNTQTLWQFNSGFPKGFSNITKLVKKYHASLGVWISPWGGYDEAKKQRLEYGKVQTPPFETNENGFSLSGPVYFNRFKSVTADFITKYSVSMFKFDGVGAGDATEGASSRYEKDIDALLKLVGDLRAIKPDLYVSLTIGTWPSPYWLYYGDAIWRNGWDTGLAGVGSNRQQWITYRDDEAYKNIVQRGPLFPLNSLMYHGICIADNGIPGKLEMNDKDISDEIWSFFASGTAIQELYINPHKLSSKNWNCLAHAIQWAQKNESTFADVHWIGGNPVKGEIYGRAAWSSQKALISLRNPSAETKSFHINVTQLMELPEGAPKLYNFHCPEFFHKDMGINTKKVQEFDVTLQPYEVLILEGEPVK